jgi:hypothetical protein
MSFSQVSNDFDLAFNLSVNSLSHIPKNDIDNILQHIRELMTSIWTYFNPDCEFRKSQKM